jgi:hypothetical protein
MESENLSVEQRLAKLEEQDVRREGSIRAASTLLFAGFVLYLLWSMGYVKFTMPSAEVASA